MTAFDLAGPLPTGRTVIEASAGTGKTYTITALIVRAVAEDVVKMDELLVVTFTRAAVNELRDRTRTAMRRALAELDGTLKPAQEPWMRVLADVSPDERRLRRDRLGDAVSRFDEATITTIHGFCQQALVQGGLRSGTDPASAMVEGADDLVVEVCRDVLVRALADRPYALSVEGKGPPRPPGKVEAAFRSMVTTAINNPLATLAPEARVGPKAAAWRTAVVNAVDEIARRRRLRRQVAYDGLITDLLAALDGDDGPALAAHLSNRFRFVLVDEFQDTDRAQWHIFSTIFGRGRLVTVGDPKQAIYRFRGADLRAYLDAVRTSPTASLPTNYRSDRRLLSALEHLLHGWTLGHAEVSFLPVQARDDAPESVPGDGAALGFHLVLDDENLAHRSRAPRALTADAAQRVVLGDLAWRVRTLLDGTGRPNDIAVLVNSQAQATAAAATLRRWGVPSARASTGSVLDAPAATQWRVLVAALSSPTRAPSARGAGLGWCFDSEPAALADPADSGPLADVRQKLARWADLMRRQGVGPMYEEVRSSSALLDVVLSGADGDRHLADLDHIAELLVTATSGRPVDPHHVRELLDQLVADADPQREDTMRRIETDQDAVHITTIHAAKGLEYPVVMLPFGYAMNPRNDRPYAYGELDEATGQWRRTIDVASWVPWNDAGDADTSKSAEEAHVARKELAGAELDGDTQRLLYVALTRAKHRVDVWWAFTASNGSSPLGRIIFDRHCAGPVRNNAKLDPTTVPDDVVQSQLEALRDASAGAIDVDFALLDPPVPTGPARVGPDLVELRIGSTNGRSTVRDPSWRSWSFTAIAATMHDDRPMLPPPDEAAAGGSDEPTTPTDEELPDPASVEPGTTPEVSAAGSAGAVVPLADVPLADVVAGTTFGTMVHELLELVDFTTADLLGSLREAAEVAARRAGLVVDADVLARGLVAAVETPLGPHFDGLSLRAFAPSDRLAEMAFDMAVADHQRPADTGQPERIEARQVAQGVLDHLALDDVLRPYFADLRTQLGPTPMSGWLTGSIDGVFRVRPVSGPGAGTRFVVVDYKSNRLHAPGDSDPLAAYHPDRLVTAMAEHHYPLQAALYSVALHRFLTWRMGPGYDPDVQLGGVGYLFVRGMIGPDTPSVDGVAHGVFSYRFPTAAVLALDGLLAGAKA
ncbi:exodeoxyribonuclease V subunit beta [soil metagenome]